MKHFYKDYIIYKGYPTSNALLCYIAEKQGSKNIYAKTLKEVKQKIDNQEGIKTMKEYEKFITVKFSYNGDLGKLQLQSKINMEFAARLHQQKIITDLEYFEIAELIREYFKEELRNALNNLVYTLN